jgi:DNA ligase-1
MTDKYPDLVALVPEIRGDGVESFIMEGEVVAVDRATGELKNFQTLTNRARKDVAIGSITIDVCLFAFDLMYLNGESLLDEPFRRRRDLLRSLFVEIPHHFTWVKSLDATSQDSEVVLEFFKSALDSKCEGIMVKILDNLPDLEYRGDDDGEDVDALSAAPLPPPPPPKQSPTKLRKPKRSQPPTSTTTEPSPGPPPAASTAAKTRRKPLPATYTPDKRVDAWLKVKKDYSASTSDTLDLVPIAAWHGQGRKAQWWSPILLAVRNDASGCLEAVCKCMSGFTDAFYRANRARYDPDAATGGGNSNTHERKPAFVEYDGPAPDVWFEPREVWEVAFADVTVSPTYTAAIGLAREDRGLSLRFPRFLRVREDKGVEEASTSEFLAGLWRKQDAKAVVAGGGTGIVEEEGRVDGEEDMED